MKASKRTIIIGMCLMIILGSLTQCGQAEAKVKIKKLILNKKKVTLYVGNRFTIKVKKAVGKNVDNKAGKKVTFKTSSKKIARVSKKGVVTGVSKGKATITVTSAINKKVKAKVNVTVKKKNVKHPVTSDTQQVVNNNVISNTNQVVSTSEPVENIFNPDYSELVSRSDITYEGIITFGPYGLPVAN